MPNYAPWNGYFNTGPRRPPNKAFIWPHGGKVRGKGGRLRDIMTGRGPDIYVAFNHNKKPNVLDGPSKGRWTGWGGYVDHKLTHFNDAHNYLGDASWLGGIRSPRRHPRKRYDFRTRRYGYPQVGAWADALFYPESKYPSAVSTFPDFMRTAIHPEGGMDHMDPVNFHSDVLGGIGGQGGYWTPAHGPFAEYWDRTGPFGEPEHHWMNAVEALGGVFVD